MNLFNNLIDRDMLSRKYHKQGSVSNHFCKNARHAPHVDGLAIAFGAIQNLWSTVEQRHSLLKFCVRFTIIFLRK